MLGVQANVGEALDADWLEGAQAYMEGNVLDLHAFGAEFGEDLGGEVEAGGGGGGGARLGGVDGLVAGLVVGGIWLTFRAVDVGRERHVADAVEMLEEGWVGDESECALAVFFGGQDLGGQHDRAGVVGE